MTIEILNRCYLERKLKIFKFCSTSLKLSHITMLIIPTSKLAAIKSREVHNQQSNTWLNLMWQAFALRGPASFSHSTILLL